MKKAPKKLKSRVVEGSVVHSQLLEPRLVPAAEQSVPQRQSKCPVCQVRVGTRDVAIGVMFFRVCQPCAEPYDRGLDFLRALTRFL